MLCFLGLIPAVAFYVCGYVLSGLLVLGSALCELILRQSFRCVVLIISSLLSWITRSASNASLTQETYRSIRRSFWYAYVVFIAFCCLLIRSAARSLIRLEDCFMWLDRGASPFEHKGRAFAGIWLRLVWWQFYLVIFGETLRLAA